MKRHLNRKKAKLAEIDPEHLAFWEHLFSTPFSTLLEHEPGEVSGKSTYRHTYSETAALTIMAQKHTGVIAPSGWMHPFTTQITEHNVCILKKVPVLDVSLPDIDERHRWYYTIPRSGDMITAFYFPLIPGLSEVQLEVGGQTIARWTPEGSEFRAPPMPLTAILEECRGLPALHVDWERILAVCREEGDYSRIDHDFGRDIELEGVQYRRAVLVHPCLPMIGLVYQNAKLLFLFQDSAEDFVYYQEYWTLEMSSRRFLAQNALGMSSQSDTFEDDSNIAKTSDGCMGLAFCGETVTISDLGILLQNSVRTARVHSNLTTLSTSGCPIQK